MHLTISTWIMVSFVDEYSSLSDIGERPINYFATQ